VGLEQVRNVVEFLDVVTVVSNISYNSTWSKYNLSFSIYDEFSPFRLYPGGRIRE
jgi:hypothetical protein